MSPSRSFRSLLVGALVLTLALPLLLASPASAAEVGGIEVLPVPASREGKAVVDVLVELSRSQERQALVTVRNTNDAPATVEVYSAAAHRSSSGAYSVSGADSSDLVVLDRIKLTLAPGESRVLTARVRPLGKDETPPTHAAIVLELDRGSLVERLATLVTLKPPRALPSVPLLLIALALALITLTAAGVLVARRQNTST